MPGTPPISIPLIPVERPARKVFPAGTIADGTRRDPDPGRYHVLGGDGQQFLYVPESQALFSIAESLAAVLRAAEAGDPELAPASRSLVLQLQAELPQQPLDERRHADDALRDVVLHVSQVCNLACVYCYASELNAVNRLMSERTAHAVIEHTLGLAMRSDPPRGLASVKFLGGEPTIAWPVIEYCMAEYTARSRAMGLEPPRFTMVTNGQRMTDAMIASAARYGMYVLVSLDGPALIHDALRPTKSGKGSYALAESTLRRLAASGVDVAVESVYTRQHLEQGIRPQDLVNHFLSLGVREFQIQPTVGVWHDSDIIDQNEQVTASFSDAVASSVRSFRGSDPYLLRGIQFVLDGFSMRERRRYVCGAGRTFMGINYDGEAFPCYLLESPDLSYGFIGGQWREDKYQSVKQAFTQNGKEYHAVCRGCWANEICQSCLGTSFQIDPAISKPPAWFCQFQKKLIATVLTEIALARNSGDWQHFVDNLDAHLTPIKIADVRPPRPHGDNMTA